MHQHNLFPNIPPATQNLANIVNLITKLPNVLAFSDKTGKIYSITIKQKVPKGTMQIV